MAPALSIFLSRSRALFMITIFLLSAVSTSAAAKPFKLPKSEKMSHLHFYFHDIVSGPNPTAVKVAKAAGRSPASFGTVVMIDDPLTEGPDPKSKLLGRAQGLYALASQEEAGLLMALNYVFVEGKYNGSTLSILGRNAVFDKVREMPVLGGSGLFRFARGYAQARTHYFNFTTGDAVVEYDVYVIHY